MLNMQEAQKLQQQQEALVILTERVPDGLRDLIASKISGLIDGAALVAAIEAQNISA